MTTTMGREGSAAELLELVRSAEEGAFVSTSPSGNPLAIAPSEEEFVDVGDEAVEATPSTPIRIPTPLRLAPTPVVRPAPSATSPSATSSPLVAIVTLFAMAIAVLASLAR